MIASLRERRLLNQATNPEQAREPAATPEGMPAAMQDAGDSSPELVNTFSQATHAFEPMFKRYPEAMQQQLWPQIQGVYATMTEGIEQNYDGMLQAIQKYSAMNGAWPNDVVSSASTYPHGGQSDAYPQPETWYTPSPGGTSAVGADADGAVQTKGEPERVADAPSGGFEDFPEAMRIFGASTFRMVPAAAPLACTTLIGGVSTVYDLGADGLLKTGGKAVDIAALPFSLGRAGGAVAFASRVAGRFTFRSGAEAPITRDVAPEPRRPSAFVALPSRFIRNQPSTFSIDPADAPVTVDVTDGDATKRYAIQANGTIATPDDTLAPFTVTRLLGAITITPKSGTLYALKNGAAESRIAVADTVVVPKGLTLLTANQESRDALRLRAQRGDQLLTKPLFDQQDLFRLQRKKPFVLDEYREGDVTGADAIGDSAADQEFGKLVNALPWGSTMKHRIEGRLVHMSYRGWMRTCDTAGKTPAAAAALVREELDALFIARGRSLGTQEKFDYYQSLDRCFTGATRWSDAGTTVEVFKDAKANDWEHFGCTRTVNGVTQRWFASVFTTRSAQGVEGSITLRRADDPSTQINVELQNMFTNIEAGMPAIKAEVEQAMRRAEAIRASERADAARIRTFELPRDRPIGYIGLYDRNENMTKNTMTDMPRMLASRGHTFVTSGDVATPVNRAPLAMMEERVTELYRSGVHDFYISLGVHGSMTGMAFRDGSERYPLTPEQIGTLVDAHPDCRFTFDVIACHTGGLDAPNLGTNLYTELSSAHAGRVTVFVHTKQIVNNIATGIRNGGRDWSDATSFYTFFLLHYLDQKKPDGSPLYTYGEAHLLADEAIKRTLPGLDPAVIRSGVAGGERTARSDAHPPLPPGISPGASA